MDTTTYIGLSHMTSLRRQMDMVANNIANMDTAGYKSEKPLFTPFLEKSLQGRGDKATFVEDFGNIRDLSVGTITPTGNPLDIAINGEGYFSVKTPDGTQFTRVGTFSLDSDGMLVTRQGLPVLDEGGAEIILPPEAKDITISADGSISTDQGPLARIELVEFENPRALAKLENGLYSTTQDPLPMERFVLRQGMVEGSNVVAVTEMSEMINISRAYESAQKLIDNEHSRIRTAIRQLAGTQ